MPALAIIPPSVTKAVVPKPTKTEIIEAAAQRELEKRLKAYHEEKTRRENAESELRARVLAHVVEHIGRLQHSASVRSGRGADYQDKKYTSLCGAVVSFDITKDLPKKLHADILAHENLPNLIYPQIKQVRGEVREALAGHQPADKQARINALLTDAKSSKAIDAMLKAAFDKPSDKPAAIPC
jgi:hypothetical protein